MPSFTMISRLSDGLVLCGSMDALDSGEYRELDGPAKKIVRSLSPTSAPRMHIDAGAHYFTYVLRCDCAFLTVSDRTFPKHVAVAFLEDVAAEFEQSYGALVASASYPHQFIKFDSSIKKTQKLFEHEPDHASANGAQGNKLARLNNELGATIDTMVLSMKDLAQRGDKIDLVSRRADELLSGAGGLQKAAWKAKNKMWWRTYGSFFVVLAVVVLFLLLRYFVF